MRVPTAALVGLVLALVGAARASAQVVDQDAAQEVDAAHRAEEAPPPPTAVLPEDREPTPGPTPPPIDLFPQRVLGGAAGLEIPDMPPPDDEEDQAEAHLEELLDDDLRRDRLEAGVVSGWYYEMGFQMRRRFRPDMGRVRGEHQAGMDIFERALDELGRYGPHERPIDTGGSGVATPEARARSIQAPGESTAQAESTLRQMDFQNLLNGHTNWYRVELRVRWLRDGSVATVRVTRSSGSQTLDAAAVAAVRSAAREGGVAPPESIARGRDWIEADWAFEAGDVATDLATAGCTEGPDGEDLQCGVLGRGITRTRMFLLRFVDATMPSAAERRAERLERRRTRDEAAAATPPP